MEELAKTYRTSGVRGQHCVSPITSLSGCRFSLLAGSLETEDYSMRLSAGRWGARKVWVLWQQSRAAK